MSCKRVSHTTKYMYSKSYSCIIREGQAAKIHSFRKEEKRKREEKRMVLKKYNYKNEIKRSDMKVLNRSDLNTLFRQ